MKKYKVWANVLYVLAAVIFVGIAVFVGYALQHPEGTWPYGLHVLIGGIALLVVCIVVGVVLDVKAHK
ncbi:MAG: hypothetical protein J5645_09540 [Lachnospiraceae bacterium]|nr:hypothetical protein [Lachnospiraceae bacterium]